MSEKKDTRRHHRTYLGRAATETTNGTYTDPRLVLHIGHPDHTLNKKGLYDAARYRIGNSKFDALLDVIRRIGCPSPVQVRINGTIKDPALLEYAATFPDKGHKDEPRLETISGNRRLAGLLIVNAEREAKGLKPYRLPIVFRPVNDPEMVQLFVEENEIRDGNGLYQRLLIVRDTFNRGEGYDDLGHQFGLPAKEVSRIFEPMRIAHDDAAKAFADGHISLAALKKLNKYPQDEVPLQLEDCRAKRGAWAPAPKPKREPKLSTADKALIAAALESHRALHDQDLTLPQTADLRDLMDRLEGWKA